MREKAKKIMVIEECGGVNKALLNGFSFFIF